MRITLNGQERELTNAQTLKDVIREFQQDCNRIIAELNGQIIKNPQWEKTPVHDGDRIELLSFVGGG